MRSALILTVLAVAILVSAGAGYLVGSTVPMNQTTGSATATSCVQTGIHGSLYVRAISDGADGPISGAHVTVTILNYCNSEHTVSLGLTNATGYAPAPADWTGALLVNVTRAGTSYVFLAQTSGAASLATLSLPSGLAVMTPIACYSPFPAACGNATTTSTAYAVG